MKNQKAQIGSTLNWVIAFIIILFIVIIFTSVAALLSANKSLSSVDIRGNSGHNEISIEGEETITNNLKSQRDLISFLLGKAREINIK